MVYTRKLCFIFIEDGLKIATNRNKWHTEYEWPKCRVWDVGGL